MMFKFLIVFFSLLLSLSACDSSNNGSGGGIGGSGIRPIEVTGATLGPISEFGSIVVNDVRFDTDNASFFLNDEAISQGELSLGMNVLAAVDFSNNEASRVDYVPSLIGPVDSVNVENKTFRSLGQTVRLSNETVYENTSLSEISAGVVIEVSGLRDATGNIISTFVRPAADITRFQLVGTVLSELSDDEIFSLNGLQVNISRADLSQLLENGLNFGEKVYVTGLASSYNPTSVALSVDSVRPALEPLLAVGERVEYEGIVSTFVSPFEFDVYWQPIRASEQTRVEFQDGSLANLSMIMLNSRLEIEGTVLENGAYQATKIVLIASENSKFEGSIERVSSELSTFTVLGLDIESTDETHFEGSSDDSGSQEVSSFEGLVVGGYVEVDAALVGNRLIAIDVKVDDPDERAILEGPVTEIGVTSESLMIVNTPISLGPQTNYESGDDIEISREAFFEQLQIGVIVKAKWDDFQSLDLPPDSLEFD